MHGRTSKSLRGLAAVLVALGLVAALAVLAGASWSANASQYQYGKKMTICHHTHSKTHPQVTITVGAPAVKAHLKHGDTLGACSASPTNSTATQGKGHGKGHGKGLDKKGKGH